MTVEDPEQADDGPDLDPSSWSIRDEDARRYVGEASSQVASLVESTLGPRGMSKLVQAPDPHEDGTELILSDSGREVLDTIHRGGGFNHPVSALFIDSVESMQLGVHDGTTTAVVLADRLIDRGLELVERGLHPQNVVIGYAMATSRAGAVLDDLDREIDLDDRSTLRAVAATSMTDSIEDPVRDRYSRLVADAVADVAVENEGNIVTDDVKTVVNRLIEEDRVYRGLVVRQHTPEDPGETETKFYDSPPIEERLVDAGVAVIDQEVDFEEVPDEFSVHRRKDSGAGPSRMRVASPAELDQYRNQRDARIAATAREIASLGVDLFVSQPAVDEPFRRALRDAGVDILDRIDTPMSDIHRIARTTGATVVEHPDDLTAEHVGTADAVEQREIEGERWTVLEGTERSIYTITAVADMDTSVSQRERILEDAIEVASLAASDRRVAPGAGAPAMAVATALRDYARSISDREQLAVEAFADALEEVLRTMLRNSGLDPTTGVTALRSAHEGGETRPAPIGLDLRTGEPTDAWEAGVVEPRRVFSQAIETARMTAEQLLVVDSVLFPDVDLANFDPDIERR
jgi:chaperonin GroEL (HSP60 family)